MTTTEVLLSERARLGGGWGADPVAVLGTASRLYRRLRLEPDKARRLRPQLASAKVRVSSLSDSSISFSFCSYSSVGRRWCQRATPDQDHRKRVRWGIQHKTIRYSILPPVIRHLAIKALTPSRLHIQWRLVGTPAIQRECRAVWVPKTFQTSIWDAQRFLTNGWNFPWFR